MSNIETIIQQKKDIDGENRRRLILLIPRFKRDCLDDSCEFVDITYLPGYFTTYVFKVIFKRQEEVLNYYLKLAWIPESGNTRFVERINFEFEKTEEAYNLFEHNDVLKTVKPMRLYRQEGAFFMQEMIGRRQDTLLISAMRKFPMKNNEALLKSFYLTGQWLKSYQELNIHPEKARFSIEEIEGKVQYQIGRINEFSKMALNSQQLSMIESKTRSIIEQFSEDDFKVVAKHNDFAPWNVLKDEEGITVFDFADSGFDLGCYDYFNFINALNSFNRRIFKRKSLIEAAKENFSQGYLEAGSPDKMIKQYFELFFTVEKIRMLVHSIARCSGIAGNIRKQVYKQRLRETMRVLKKLIR
ncbi:hypothetical protein [Aliikangiella coralliicola]|uniref:Aminoglycoside phosphotransferase domain-containing protein n=1 Tax=Aliikangiella coralliicola TaxID=2592383 RepID=A0A545UHF6_9GAMM|nr:hypothetical protein [Aliikangiella coralliicola]TQV88888.1 hypothetical protein FLL46_04965 [Aliikangiella coralliicola]